MRYGVWSGEKERFPRAFYERAYQRQSLAAWDDKWHRLSDQARNFFLNVVKGPAKPPANEFDQLSVSIDKLPPHILKELTTAGFVEVQRAKSQAYTDRVIACSGLYDFATRVRTLQRLHLLATDKPSEFTNYVEYVFFSDQLIGVLIRTLRTVGIQDYFQVGEMLNRYVMNYRWPRWAARELQEPLADRILDVVQEADGPVLLADLLGRIKGSSPNVVRSVVDKLVTHLALVEDVKPGTWELMVGFLPAVRDGLIRASRPRERPPLLVCERPKEIGPEGSPIINDLRAVLLEVASEPPRLRQDQALFQKEIERFQAALEPIAAWLMEALEWSNERRLNRSLAWARTLQLVAEVIEGKQIQLHLTSKGYKWLSSGLDEQYTGIYNLLRTHPARDEYSPYLGSDFPGSFATGNLGPGDMRFLGEHVTAIRVEKGKFIPGAWSSKPEDHQALRKGLDRALAALKADVFYRLDSVESNLVFEGYNPVNRGLALDQVVVYWIDRPVPPLEEQREEIGRLLIDAFVRRRLIPLGCVRAAIDDAGKICIAREPRLDAYFGRQVARADLDPTSKLEAKVVVQPDFSVIVIGLNPAPAADLAPFCERTTRGGSAGAMVLKITRESVVKAVSHGLKPAEIVARLQRHASNEVPANVLREVQDWSNWVRRVTASTLTVVRCPDQDTADRVVAALKRQAQRVNDTLVAIDQKKLTSTERNKLRDHGIIVEGESEAAEGKAKARKKKKRASW
jgi:Helicase conserved C-terminal domain